MERRVSFRLSEYDSEEGLKSRALRSRGEKRSKSEKDKKTKDTQLVARPVSRIYSRPIAKKVAEIRAESVSWKGMEGKQRGDSGKS
jgi:hypothetical protein